MLPQLGMCLELTLGRQWQAMCRKMFTEPTCMPAPAKHYLSGTWHQHQCKQDRLSNRTTLLKGWYALQKLDTDWQPAASSSIWWTTVALDKTRCLLQLCMLGWPSNDDPNSLQTVCHQRPAGPLQSSKAVNILFTSTWPQTRKERRAGGGGGGGSNLRPHVDLDGVTPLQSVSHV